MSEEEFASSSGRAIVGVARVASAAPGLASALGYELDLPGQGSPTRAPAKRVSGAAIGWIYFASMMMVLIGSFHAIVGLVAIIDDEFYVVTREYVFQFDATQWGWIQLIWGILVATAGAFLLTGSVVARTVGVLMALGSAILGFAWLPYYPVWGVIIIAIAMSVIWALTAHGRDAANDY